MMRINLKRVFVLAFAVFGTTIVILSLPRTPQGKVSAWEDPLYSRQQSAEAARVGRKFLQQKERGPAENGAQRNFPRQPPPPSIDDDYQDTDPLNFRVDVNRDVLDRLDEFVKELDLGAMATRECGRNLTLKQFWRGKGNEVPEADSWEQFYSQIASCAVYNDEPVIQKLLTDLNTLPIQDVHIMEGGTQVKLVFTFSNGKQAVFKPMRFGRDYESDPNHFYFSDFERHNAEIATYHLDKVLGFRRAVPTVGRIVNISSELLEHAEKKLKKTFFISPSKNHCFVSKCDYYCDTTHAICGSPWLKEGSVQVFLPDEEAVPRKHNRSPYRRTYSKKNQLAEWQTDMQYCTDKVMSKQQYAHGRKLLDLVDLHILDFLIGNQDRHHYESFDVFTGIPSYAIHLDNGRAFGRADWDDDDILLPLRQCCVIRPSTLRTLMTYYRTPKLLSRTLIKSLSRDPVAPILHAKHYPAMERRLAKVMEYLLECFEQKPADKIVVHEYHNSKVRISFMEANEEEEEDRIKDEKH